MYCIWCSQCYKLRWQINFQQNRRTQYYRNSINLRIPHSFLPINLSGITNLFMTKIQDQTEYRAWPELGLFNSWKKCLITYKNFSQGLYTYFARSGGSGLQTNEWLYHGPQLSPISVQVRRTPPCLNRIQMKNVLPSISIHSNCYIILLGGIPRYDLSHANIRTLKGQLCKKMVTGGVLPPFWQLKPYSNWFNNNANINRTGRLK